MISFKESNYLKLISIFILLLTIAMYSSSCSDEEKEIRDVPDKKISETIENRLIIDDLVKSHEIKVKVNKGVAELTGKVDNLLRKERAADIAENIEGVRSVVNRIQVQSSEIPDDSLKQIAEMTFLNDPAVESYEIDTKVKDGILTLSGEVDSWAEKNLSEKVAKTIEGLKAVNNDITIDYDEDRPDSEIKADIEKRLKYSPYIYEGLIDVSVENGNVTLTGETGSLKEKNLARDLALVYGVKSIDTGELKVKWWLKDQMLRYSKIVNIDDEEIKKAVKDALLYDPRVLKFNVQPEVKNGYVTLSGTVDNLKAKKAAEQDARYTIGVVLVDNQITVEPEVEPTDTELLQTVSDVLLLSPSVKRSDIDISVEDGIVSLNGKVTTNYEAHRAVDLASKIMGIKEIKNNLEVEMPPKIFEDEKLERNVESRLKWSYMITPEDLNVKANNGTVTVDGYVDSWQEYYSVVNNAIEGGALILKTDIRISNTTDIERIYHFNTFYPYYF